MGAVVRVDDAAQHDICAVRQLYGAYFLNLRKADTVQHCLDAVLPERLVQIVAGADFIALAGKFIACRAEYNPHIRVAFADFPRGIHTVDPIHKDIQYNQLKSAGLPDP